MGKTKESTENRKVKELIDAGSNITGASTGAVLGLFGGPVGAVGGAISGAVLTALVKKIGVEIYERSIGKREQGRIGAAAVFAIQKIKENTDKGFKIRGDSFFADDDTGSSSAEELFEGALLKAKNSHENKKVKYIANIFGNLIFNESITAEDANLILKLADSFTYRELVCISFVIRINEFSVRKMDFQKTGMNNTTLSILHEIYDLYNNFLVMQKRESSKSPEALFGVGGIVPADLKPRPLAVTIYNLMGLSSITKEEIQDLVANFLK